MFGEFFHGEFCQWGETQGALNDLLNNTILSLVVDWQTDSPRKTSVYTLAQKKKMPIDIKPSPHGHIDIKMHLISVQQMT